MSPFNQNLSYDELKEKLLKANIKVTQQRIVIYQALLNLHNHPSAEQIYEYIRPTNPSISLGTVYKTLDTFESTGLVYKVLSPDDQQRYDANMEYHNHIYCMKTKEIIDFDDQELNKLIGEYFSRKKIKNFNIEDIRVHVTGQKHNPEDTIKIN
ncbi:MAG: Fur family transcriptional regulator [Cytophagaceae bacterium]